MFPQNNGYGCTLGQAQQAVQNLVNYGCSICGSAPYVDGNDSDGEITVNYVNNECGNAVPNGNGIC